MSGGYDSTLLAEILKKEWEPILLHYSFNTYTGQETIDKVKKIAKKLRYKEIYVLDISEMAESIVETTKHAYYFILLKRMFLKIGEEFLIQKKLNSINEIATGESIGQVGSQTLENIISIHNVTKKKILTPLICLDKQEIIDLCKEKNIYDIATGKEVCELLGPKRPVTKSNIYRVKEEEMKISNYEKNVREVVKKISKIKIT